MTAIERIVFFGTPGFSVPTLDALAQAGREPMLVVSQPTRAAGRGRRPNPPPVARWADTRGIDLVQPRRVRSPDFVARLRELAPDVAVVVAFGQIFPQELLDVPRLGCINLHASLLPRHRGASPIAAAIAAGDRETGVTTMLMEAGLDSGPILLQRRLEIGERETTGELEERLAATGAELMVETLAGLEAGTIEPRAQPEEGVTFAPRLQREDGDVDWRWTATEMDRRLRAYTPWPGLTARLRDRPLKLVALRPLEITTDAAPGEIVSVESEGIAVACGEASVVCLESVQRPGRRALSAQDFANGERLKVGERFDTSRAQEER